MSIHFFYIIFAWPCCLWISHKEHAFTCHHLITKLQPTAVSAMTRQFWDMFASKHCIWFYSMQFFILRYFSYISVTYIQQNQNAISTGKEKDNILWGGSKTTKSKRVCYKHSHFLSPGNKRNKDKTWMNKGRQSLNFKL